MTTDTPRTDDFVSQNSLLEFVEDKHELIIIHARQLERELNASQAEVAKLNHQLLKTESDLMQSQDINLFLDTEFRIACKRAERAEAERDAYKKLALELCAELCQICKDPIHLKQLEELSK